MKLVFILCVAKLSIGEKKNKKKIKHYQFLMILWKFKNVIYHICGKYSLFCSLFAAVCSIV